MIHEVFMDKNTNAAPIVMIVNDCLRHFRKSLYDIFYVSGKEYSGNH